ncbi:Clr6 histone deacetylase associated PHD protein-2 Cph2 [Clarireedia jacksonii]
MKTRINAFEKLFVSGSMGFAPIQQPMNHYQFAPGFNTPGPSPSSDQGMIPVPDDMRRLHGQMSQEAFAVPTQYNQNRQPLGPNGWQGGGYFGKLMVGSLAGLMIMQGFHEAEQDTDAPGARGLFAFPAHVLKLFSYHLHSALDFHYQGYHVPASQTIHFLQVLLVAGLIFYVFLPSLVAPKPKSTGSKTTQLAAAPSLASSIQVRRQAWLTAIQTVWVPRHNFFLEAAALCMKVGKFTLRNIVGSSLYSWATGATEEQEAARVKAWTIALDAQLTGGDVEVSKSRLTLTLLASGTLPDTPARLMLKALHIRVLLWEIGNTSFAGPYIQKAARELARWKWNEAKQLQQILSHSKEQQDELPEYIATILEQKCDDVLVDAIVQRAYNLAWNLPTTNNTEVNCGMDRVVEDFAIRSPLDAVAAWSSSLTLHRALAKSLGAEAEGATASKSIGDEIDISIKTAPPGSTAQLRALVARAVLVKDKRGKSIAIALKALGAGQQKAPIQSNVNIKMAITNLPDIQTSIHCAMALAYLERYPMPANPDNAPKIINSIVPANLTLLGFTAMFKLIEKMHDHTLIASTCANALGRFAGSLRIWVGGKEGEKSGLETELKRAMVEKCLTITAQALGMEKDAGYETMSDDGDSEGC